MLIVVNRDGTVTSFKESKIYDAIRRASEATQGDSISYEEIRNVIMPLVYNYAKDRSRILVEDIQDIVEFGLYKSGHFLVMKRYMLYRHKRQTRRAMQADKLEDTIMSIVRNENEELASENSNKDIRSAGTQRDYIAGVMSTHLTRTKILPEHITKAHDEGAIHFHDADYAVQPIFNCCLSNVDDMLMNGTAMNGKMIERPKSFKVACTVMTQIIASVSSHQYGGQSVDLSALGYFLHCSRERYKKMVSKRNLSESEQRTLVGELLAEELQAGVQTIQYQINTLMTTNGQSPFITLFMHTDENHKYLKENVAIFAEVLAQRLKGIKNEHGVYVTPAFPKLVYVLDENNKIDEGEYGWLTKMAAACTAKRMYPDYLSAKQMRAHYEGSVFSPMGCRSFLSPWSDENGEYQYKGRFNQGVVSLNLPQIAILSGRDIDVFWDLMEDRTQIVYDALMVRHKSLLGTLSDISPIHWQQGAIARLKPGETIDRYLKNGYSSISMGYIGIYETVKYLTGLSHTTPEGEKLALEILTYLEKKTAKWKAETNIGFGLYGTPAESLCYRFARIDKERFGSIPDITDKGYYTNSYHVDVREDINVFAKFDFESQFQRISSGGCISYAEIPNLTKNPQALYTILNYIYDNIQYAEFNTKSDFCHMCKFDGEVRINSSNEWECPNCGNSNKNLLTVVRRTCGYLGENFWNNGKTQEIGSRVMHLN